MTTYAYNPHTGDTESLTKFLASWKGHAQWANSYNLLTRLGVAA